MAKAKYLVLKIAVTLYNPVEALKMSIFIGFRKCTQTECQASCKMKQTNLLTPAWLLLPAIEERVMIFFNELKQMTGYWCTTSSPNQEELSKSNIILQRIRKRKKRYHYQMEKPR
jgi:hypothetical protein